MENYMLIELVSAMDSALRELTLQYIKNGCEEFGMELEEKSNGELFITHKEDKISGFLEFAYVMSDCGILVDNCEKWIFHVVEDGVAEDENVLEEMELNK